MQRLESITIHWTRQIKVVVNQQVSTGAVSGLRIAEHTVHAQDAHQQLKTPTG